MMIERCPICSGEIRERVEQQEFGYLTPIGTVPLVAVVPVYECAHCEFWYTNHIAEECRTQAVLHYLLAPIWLKLLELYRPEEARTWLATPSALLGWRTATDLVLEGQTDRVLQVISRLLRGESVVSPTKTG